MLHTSGWLAREWGQNPAAGSKARRHCWPRGQLVAPRASELLAGYPVWGIAPLKFLFPCAHLPLVLKGV